MKNHNEAWFTLYNQKFNTKAYLYHFTNIEKATIILDGNSLKFSKLNKLNDTLEAKPKIFNTYNALDTYCIIEHFKNTNEKYLQLLCFSMDAKQRQNTDNNKIYYTDYSGRGFALPRMWAQYSNNNDGVCFVFDKEKLTKLIKNSVRANLIHFGKVKYETQFKQYEIFDLEKIKEYIVENSDELTNAINDIDFLKNNKSFVDYNYFTKLSDWINENEFRFLAYGTQDIYVENISQALVGVIIGENIKSNNEKIIKYFCEDICEIKKITFSFNGCQLKNIYFKDEGEI